MYKLLSVTVSTGRVRWEVFELYWYRHIVACKSCSLSSLFFPFPMIRYPLCRIYALSRKGQNVISHSHYRNHCQNLYLISVVCKYHASKIWSFVQMLITDFLVDSRHWSVTYNSSWHFFCVSAVVFAYNKVLHLLQLTCKKLHMCRYICCTYVHTLMMHLCYWSFFMGLWFHEWFLTQS